MISILDRDDTHLPDWYLDEGSPWEKINSYVLQLRETNSRYPIWRAIEEFPLSKDFIDGIVEEGWRVIYEPDFFFLGGITHPPEKNIILKAELKPYQRDRTLFHELAHLRHPLLLSYQTANDQKQKCEREVIVEWLGRKARADPGLLRHAVLSFGLDAYIYDKSSYQAFQGIKGQQCFSFMREEYKDILMD